MAANCIADLETAVKAVKDEYGNDPKWADVISSADKAVSAAHSLEGNTPPVSPGKDSANQVHDNQTKVETPAQDKAEPAAKENSETPVVEKDEHPKDMKGAARMALIMLRGKK